MEPDLLPHATEFSFLPAGASFGDNNVQYFTVTVSRRSNGLWAVLWMGQCWNARTKDWEYEPSPSGRSEDFLVECRLSLQDAVRVAHEAPNTLTVNGKTWLDFQAAVARQVEP